MWQWLRKLVSPGEGGATGPDTSARNLQGPSSPPARTPEGYPNTLAAELKGCNFPRPVVFDPALRHLVNGVRAGEPHFPNGDLERQWHLHRLRALHLMLERISQSEFAEHLVLRGSVLLASWFGERARRPGDLDWVVIPAKWQVSDRKSSRMIEGIERLLRGVMGQSIPAVMIPDEKFEVEDIWTYEKAPGQRMIVPWKCPAEDARGTIELDFVFGERMPSDPLRMAVRLGDLPEIVINAVSPEQSLAWKILWLATDGYPMGKDLFDAVLLAESTLLGDELLTKTFQFTAERDNVALREFRKEGPRGWRVAWEGFQMEYPQVTGTAFDWQKRLSALLGIPEDAADS